MATTVRPTGGELEILRVLWAKGPSTVREVHAALGGRTGYTSVLKLMQIMAEKGLVARDESAKTHVYSAKIGEEQTQRTLVGELIEKAFGGSAKKLMVAALSGRKASRQELAEIRRLIDEMERGAK
jgi:predicted transcriptional regulator